MREKLIRREYEKLSDAQREELLRAIASKDARFHLLRFERFERFGRGTDTALYDGGGREFVFVPGDTVTLGWEDFIHGMNETTRVDLSETLAEYGITDWLGFLRERMSPVRERTIRPLLVERHTQAIGWHRVDADGPEMAPYRSEIARYTGRGYFEIHKEMRLRYEDGLLIAERYAPVSYEAFVAGIRAEGFSLPSEDEWEYLHGGGSRTLFPWGDSFDYDMKLRHFEEFQADYEKFCRAMEKADGAIKKVCVGAPYSLQEPNAFGLCIAHDPYRYEVMEDSEFFLKGGDGGCNICGGMGVMLGYLPLATYYRDPNIFDDNLDYLNDIGGDYSFYRRILRL